MALFETLAHMAKNNMDITRYDTVDAVSMRGKMGKLTMRTHPNIVHQLGGIGEQTHIPILFVVNYKQYQEIEKLLASKGE